MEWQLDEAEERLDDIVIRALQEGPQRVVAHDSVVVVVSEEEYLRLAGRQMSFKDHLLNAPDFTGVDLERNQSPMREVDL